jgi:F-box protein 8
LLTFNISKLIIFLILSTYLSKQVLENVIILHNYENQFLPTALRRFFSKIEAPKERNSYLSLLLEKFSKRFCSCNPDLGLSEEAVYILCFSLILLSVDLSRLV